MTLYGIDFHVWIYLRSKNRIAVTHTNLHTVLIDNFSQDGGTMIRGVTGILISQTILQASFSEPLNQDREIVCGVSWGHYLLENLKVLCWLVRQHLQ